MGFGSDPEIFLLDKEGSVVPSKVLLGESKFEVSNVGEVVQDGFQVELHPYDSFCRQIAASNIAYLITEFDKHVREKGYMLSFAHGYTLKKKEFERLPVEERVFGCNPTVNAYDEFLKKPSGETVRLRTGGGHIHLALPHGVRGNAKYAEKLVRVLDILVGNTCVLFDQTEASTKRRKYYGRAGEFRMKPYGIEYRVPSNFWLRSYFLWSMVSGLSREAVMMTLTGSVATELIDCVDEKDIRKAINSNDAELAMANLQKVAEFLKAHQIETGAGLSHENIDIFLRIVKNRRIMSQFKRTPTVATVVKNWKARLHGADGFERTLDKNIERVSRFLPIKI
jgi:hypothetical protein